MEERGISSLRRRTRLNNRRYVTAVTVLVCLWSFAEEPRGVTRAGKRGTSREGGKEASCVRAKELFVMADGRGGRGATAARGFSEGGKQ